MKCKYCENEDYKNKKCYVKDNLFYQNKKYYDFTEVKCSCDRFIRVPGSDDDL